MYLAGLCQYVTYHILGSFYAKLLSKIFTAQETYFTLLFIRFIYSMDIGNSQFKKAFSSTGGRLGTNRLLDTGMGKLPPQALEIEEAVLGALMIEKDALTNVIDILKPESFYKDSHKEIYRAILDLFSMSEPVDILTVTQRLRNTGKLEMAGGPFYITELTSRVNSAANIEAHARIITQQSIKRELISIASEIQRDAYEDTTDVFQLLDKTEQNLFTISESNIRKNFADMRSLMQQAIKELESKKDHKDGLTGVPTGFSALDRVTSGWQRSDLVILAARPGMGKTAFVVSAMRNAAVEFGHAVAIFSLEMSSIQLVNRLISAEAELSARQPFVVIKVLGARL